MIRLGRIPYINCAPVYGAIDRQLVKVPAELITGTPAELNELLAAGELDVSVVSAVEYARNARAYVLLPDLAVSSDGPVRSVLLFSRRPIESLDDTVVLLSASSRTSVLLVELLCRDRWNISPRFVTARAEVPDLEALDRLPHDGVLVIGDPALVLAQRGRYPYHYDLGSEWRAWTGLPFVFAVWAARRSAPVDAVRATHHRLLESRAWGLGHLDLLAEAAFGATGIPVGLCREYLSGLDYGLTTRHLDGLREFFNRLVSRGLVPDGSLTFLTAA